MDNNLCSNPVQQTYTAEEVAKILGVSIRKAYSLCETTKDFKVMRLGKRCLRVHKESFDLWFNKEFDAH
jgi:hypothetical protein